MKKLDLYVNDNRIFDEFLKENNIKTKKYKIIPLDNGMGDHIVFESILDDLLVKYDDCDIIIGLCYKEPFEKYFNNERIKFCSLECISSLINMEDF